MERVYTKTKGNKTVIMSRNLSTNRYVVSFRFGDAGSFRELMTTDWIGEAYRYYNDLLK